MNRRTTRRLLPAAAALSLIVACSAKPKPAAAPELKPVAASPAPPPAAAPTAIAETAPKEPAPYGLTVEEMNRRGYVRDAFFDFDRYVVRPDQRDTLASDAAWLREHPTVKVLIEGHCDERGTSQYNMALGQQRAEAVKDYLVGLGIDGSRIQIISYGKERPFASGHDEEAWSQNRRDHFLVTAS